MKGVNMKIFECKFCKHVWKPRTDNKPLACPKCKRYDWEAKKEKK